MNFCIFTSIGQLQNCRKLISAIVLFIALLAGTTSSSKSYQRFVQVADSIPSNPLPKDTAGSEPFTEAVKQIMDAGFRQSKSEYILTRELYHREDIIDKMAFTIQQAKDYLRDVPDTTEIRKEILELNDQQKLAIDGIFINQESSQTYRNLTTSSLLLREILDNAQDKQRTLEKYRKDLVSFKITYDSLNADSLLYIFQEDSATLMKQLVNLMVLEEQIQPVDSMLKSNLSALEEFKFPVFRLVSSLQTNIELIENYQKELSAHLFRREIYNIWDERKTTRSFFDIAGISARKVWLALRYYVEGQIGIFVLMAFLIGLSSTFIRSLKRRQIETGNYQPDSEGQLLLRLPVLSSYLIVVSIMQFLFHDPPFVFRSILWISSAVALTVIFWRFITQFWMTMWLLILIVFTLSCADNLILQVSRPERLGILAASVFGIVIGLYFLNSGRLNELKERYILHFLRLMILLELISVIANLYGRYNFTKSMFVAGYAGVVIGITFLWTVRLINEGLALASKSITKPDSRLFYINFKKVGEKVPAVFYVLLVVGWFIQVGSNFYAYKQITTPLRNFLLSERTLGSYSFSLEGILVFMIILIIASILSKLVSYFAPDVSHTEGIGLQQNKKHTLKIGSWILLVRIFIISMGLFLAFAAAGIPVDRITIILGALGVGIGLGLQPIVINLVSGLILAFEKTVNVGDIVELDGKPGVMKSIGFRSSVIVMVDGAQVIIPNGDILNSHLINWSAGKGNRRVELLVGVAYGTDLEKARALLMDVMEKNERTLSYPPPLVLAQEFKDSSIEIRCNFWVGNFMEWALAKSEIIRSIVVVFRENGIVIPFPQHDLYLKELPVDKVSPFNADQSTEILPQ